MLIIELTTPLSCYKRWHFSNSINRLNKS